jgi:tRNA G18 (ribose-2'-O)-methylase SpoU
MEQARVVAIPRVGGAESLNVAMATAGLLTELTRQLRAPRL